MLTLNLIFQRHHLSSTTKELQNYRLHAGEAVRKQINQKQYSQNDKINTLW